MYNKSENCLSETLFHKPTVSTRNMNKIMMADCSDKIIKQPRLLEFELGIIFFWDWYTHRCISLLPKHLSEVL